MRLQKRLDVWMIATGQGIWCPDLWAFTRRDVRDKAVRDQGMTWDRLEEKGWTSHRVTITPFSNGDKT